MGFLIFIGILFLITAFSGKNKTTDNTDYDFEEDEDEYEDEEDFEDTPGFSELITGKKAPKERGMFGLTDGWNAKNAAQAYKCGEIDEADLQQLYDEGVISADEADAIDCDAVEYETEDLDKGERFDD